MKIAADTNVLVRFIMNDDVKQARMARAELEGAELVAIASPALCELVWVLSRGYQIPASRIASAIRLLINSANVAVNRLAAEAGLAALDAGGDFADGVIAFEGNRLGGDVFVSFDKQAVRHLERAGQSARLPG
jgi:predicted nucleic-acid-binding protein